MLEEIEILYQTTSLFSDIKVSAQNRLDYRQKIEILEDLIHSHDVSLYRHLTGTMHFAVRLGEELGLELSQVYRLMISSLLHDVGKLAIPDEILSKKCLSKTDWAVIETHPQYTAKILQGFGFEQDIVQASLFHHEKWNGSGYPYGISGEDIPILARILTVADVWEALNSDRPYRKAWSKTKAKGFLIEGRGKHFDPVIVDHFLNIVE